MTFVAGHNPTNLDGFEWNDLEGPTNSEMTSGGTATISTSPVRTGLRALQIGPIGSASFCELPFAFGVAGAVNGTSDWDYCPSRFYAFKVLNLMSGGQTGVFYTLCDGAPSSVNDQFWLEYTAADKIQLVNGGGVLAGPSSTSIAAGGTLIEVFTSPTQIEVRIDGSETLTAAGSFPDLDSCMFGSRAAVAGGYILNIDDWIVETSNSGTAVDWPGPGQIARLAQDSDSVDGSFLNEGASNVNLYQSIDETGAPDADTTYVRSNLTHDVYRVGFQTAAAASISGVIAAVKVQTRARNETSSPSFETRTRSTAGTDVDTAGQNFALAYSARQSVVFKSPPGTSADWATADIDALEVGGRIGANVNQAVRVTTQVVQVDYNTGTTPATHRAKVNPETIGGKFELVSGGVVGA